MSLLRTLDRTTSTIATALSRPGTTRPVLAFLCPTLCSKTSRRAFHRSAVNSPPRLPFPSAEHMDNFFIQALVRAASCPQHVKQISTYRDMGLLTSSHHKPRRKTIFGTNERRAYKSTKAKEDGPLRKVRQFAAKELKALVDYYGMNLESEPEEEPSDDEPLVWNVGNDHQPWPVKDEIHAEYIKELEQLLKNEDTPHDFIFYCYKRLPAPGVVYLTDKTIRSLLHHLSVVERATQVSMQRFLSILDDMKNSNIHIIRSEWTSAIYLAGRFMGKVSADELQSALYLWRDMEKRAGVRGGRVTLNVLFDVAVKAGKFTLAETFLKEMLARKLKVHRHFRVSLLYYYGVVQNGDAVRKTYQELVTSGDVVDTVVMNAVIAALIRASEPAAAEHVFERMKRLHASKATKHQNNAPKNWRESRKLGLHLTYKGFEHPELVSREKRTELQEFAPIGPDSRTYGLIIRHFAATVGNIDRVTELLEEMRHKKIPIDGTIFIVILYGFNSFGGVRYSSWTRDKLEQIWAQFLKSVKDRVQRTWLSSMSVIVALKAFKKCTDAERTLRAWEEVRQVWEPHPREKEAVIRVLRGLLPEHGFFDSTGNQVDKW